MVSLNVVMMMEVLPVGHVYVDDAGFQEFTIQVSARSQKPPLVVGQTISYKQHVVFLRCFTKSLPQLCLLVLYRCKDEWRRVETQTVWPLQMRANKM